MRSIRAVTDKPDLGSTGLSSYSCAVGLLSALLHANKSKVQTQLDRHAHAIIESMVKDWVSMIRL